MAPITAIVLIVLLLGVLLNVIASERREQLREKALRDTLWVSQTLQFQLSSYEDNLQRLAADLSEAREDTLDEVFRRARQLVRNNPEIIRIVLRDAQGAVRRVYPASGEALSQRPELSRALEQAHRGNSVWSDTERGANGVTLSFATPVVVETTSLPASPQGVQPVAVPGSLEATVQLDALLATHVPWWLAERYSVQLQSLDGELLASKSVSATGTPDSTGHRMTFSPPANGAVLMVTSHGDDINYLEILIVLIIVGLASLTITNLWLQRKQARRRLEAERALREEQAFRRAMEDAVTVGLQARDLAGNTLYVNAAYCRMVGWRQEDILAGRAPHPSCTLAQGARPLPSQSDYAVPPQPHTFETRYTHRNGLPFDVLVHEAPLRDAASTHVGWIGSVIDISDRKRAEAEASRQADKLQQTGRLILMGEMASTLAHELNQPLGAITSYAAGCTNMLNANTPDRDAVLGALASLRRQACRAGEIIRRIHDFVRQREPVRESCNLADIVRETAAFTRADALRHAVTIHLNVPVEAIYVRVDRVQIEQVVLNLIRNAIEALQTVLGPRVVTIRITTDAGVALVSVSDTGSGIDPEQAAKIFLPFETTKPNGMGMGLPICRSILESHQGQLGLASNLQTGASFLFSLPVAHPGLASDVQPH